MSLVQHGSPERSLNREGLQNSSSPNLTSQDKVEMEESHTPNLSILSAQAMKDEFAVEDLTINDKGAERLSNFLRNHKHYTSIGLHGNELTSNGFATICQSLKKCQDLKSVKVGWNNVGRGAAGLAALTETVQDLPSLQTIELRNNRIGKGAGPYLAALIKNAKSLREIDLRGNDLGDTEARFILATLKTLPHKVQVHLGGNRTDGLRITESVLWDIYELGGVKQPPIESAYAERRLRQERSLANALASAVKDNLSRRNSPSKQNENVPLIRNPEFESRTSLRRTSHSPQNSSFISYKSVERPLTRSSSKKKVRSPERADSLRARGFRGTDDSGEKSKKQSPYPEMAQRYDMRESYREQSRSSYYSPVKKDKESVFSEDYQSKRDEIIRKAQSYLSKDASLNQSPVETQVRSLRESFNQEMDLADKWFLQQAEQLKREYSSKKLRELKERYEQEEKEMLQALEEERKLRATTESKTRNLEAQLKQSLGQEQEFESRCEKLRNDCKVRTAQIKELVDRIERETKETEDRMQEMDNTYESQISSLNVQLEKMEQDIHLTIQQQKAQMEEMTKHWEEEYRSLTYQCDSLNQTLRTTETKHKEMIEQIRQQAEEEEREKTERALRDIEDHLVAKGLLQATPPRDYSRKPPREGGYDLGMSRTPPTVKQEGRPVSIYGLKETDDEAERIRLENQKLKEQLAEAFNRNDELENDITYREKRIEQLKEDAEAVQSDDNQMEDVDQKKLDGFVRKLREEKELQYQSEKELRDKIRELEARAQAEKEEHAGMKANYDDLLAMVQGNVKRTISETFLEVDSTTD